MIDYTPVVKNKAELALCARAHEDTKDLDLPGERYSRVFRYANHYVVVSRFTDDDKYIVVHAPTAVFFFPFASKSGFSARKYPNNVYYNDSFSTEQGEAGLIAPTPSDADAKKTPYYRGVLEHVWMVYSGEVVELPYGEDAPGTHYYGELTVTGDKEYTGFVRETEDANRELKHYVGNLSETKEDPDKRITYANSLSKPTATYDIASETVSYSVDDNRYPGNLDWFDSRPLDERDFPHDLLSWHGTQCYSGHTRYGVFVWNDKSNNDVYPPGTVCGVDSAYQLRYAFSNAGSDATAVARGVEHDRVYRNGAPFIKNVLPESIIVAAALRMKIEKDEDGEEVKVEYVRVAHARYDKDGLLTGTVQIFEAKTSDISDIQEFPVSDLVIVSPLYKEFKDHTLAGTGSLHRMRVRFSASGKRVWCRDKELILGDDMTSKSEVVSYITKQFEDNQPGGAWTDKYTPGGGPVESVTTPASIRYARLCYGDSNGGYTVEEYPFEHGTESTTGSGVDIRNVSEALKDGSYKRIEEYEHCLDGDYIGDTLKFAKIVSKRDIKRTLTGSTVTTSKDKTLGGKYTGEHRIIVAGKPHCGCGYTQSFEVSSTASNESMSEYHAKTSLNETLTDKVSRSVKPPDGDEILHFNASVEQDITYDSERRIYHQELHTSESTTTPVLTSVYWPANSPWPYGPDLGGPTCDTVTDAVYASTSKSTTTDIDTSSSSTVAKQKGDLSYFPEGEWHSFFAGSDKLHAFACDIRMDTYVCVEEVWDNEVYTEYSFKNSSSSHQTSSTGETGALSTSSTDKRTRYETVRLPKYQLSVVKGGKAIFGATLGSEQYEHTIPTKRADSEFSAFGYYNPYKFMPNLRMNVDIGHNPKLLKPSTAEWEVEYPHGFYPNNMGIGLSCSRDGNTIVVSLNYERSTIDNIKREEMNESQTIGLGYLIGKEVFPDIAKYHRREPVRLAVVLTRVNGVWGTVDLIDSLKFPTSEPRGVASPFVFSLAPYEGG